MQKRMKKENNKNNQDQKLVCFRLSAWVNFSPSMQPANFYQNSNSILSKQRLDF